MNHQLEPDRGAAESKHIPKNTAGHAESVAGTTAARAQTVNGGRVAPTRKDLLWTSMRRTRCSQAKTHLDQLIPGPLQQPAIKSSPGSC